MLAWIRQEPVHWCCECKNIILASEYDDEYDQLEFAKCSAYTWTRETKGDFTCRQFYRQRKEKEQSYCSIARKLRYCPKYAPKD